MEINIVPVEPRYHRRRSSNFWRFAAQFIFFLASLIPMCIIAWRIDLLGIGPPQQPRVIVKQVPQQPSQIIPRQKLDRKRPVENRENGIDSRPSHKESAMALDGSTQPRPATRRVRLNKDDQFVQPLAELTPIVVPFDLKKRVIRVVYTSETEPPELALCNLESSTELRARPLLDLSLSVRREWLFDSGVDDVVVGAEVRFLKRNKALVVEILPKYRLPSSDEEAFYKQAGIRKIRLLNRAIGIAANAKRAIPGLQTRLTNLQKELETANHIGNSPTIGTREYIGVTAAQLRAGELRQQGALLEEQLANAQALAHQLPRLRLDLRSVEELGKWGAAISKTATLSICIHHEGKSLLAEPK